jgi:hypothetical protein
MLKVEIQEHSNFGLQLLVLKVDDVESNPLGLQLLTLKVENRKPNAWHQKLNAKSLFQLFVQLFFFSCMLFGFIVNCFCINLAKCFL